MSDKPIRSKTGCLTCKTRRKKCDEGRPTCERCARARMDCLGYTYLDNPEELIQARTKVASRISAAKSSSPGLEAQYQSVILFSPTTAPNGCGSQSPRPARSHSVPSGLPSGMIASYDGDMNVTSTSDHSVHPGAMEPSFTGQQAVSGSPDTSNSSGDASGWWGSEHNASAFCGVTQHEAGGPEPGSHQHPATQIEFYQVPSASSRHHGRTGSFAQSYSRHSETLTRDVPMPMPPSPTPSNEALYDCDSDSTDTSNQEAFAQVVCSTSSNLDGENGVLVYVLRCYASWVMQTTFDSKRSAHLLRDYIIQRFMASEESRMTITSIANVVRNIGERLFLSPNQISDIKTLHRQTQHAIATFNATEPHIYEQGTQEARETLHHALQILPVHLAVSPLGTSVSLLREAALAFRCTVFETSDRPINLPNILQLSGMRQYSSLDVMTSLINGCPMNFRYNVLYSDLPPDTSDVFDIADALGLQWMYGCPDDFIVLLARMHNIRDDLNYMPQPGEIDKIEAIIRGWRPRDTFNEESHLAIARLAVQECWRQALLIYLLMGIGRADSGNIQVVRAHKSFMRLLKTIQPGRVPDFFLLLPLFVVAVATYRQQDRNKIYERVRGIKICQNSGTAGGDILAMMVNTWSRADAESRPTLWSDVKIAFNHVTGL